MSTVNNPAHVRLSVQVSPPRAGQDSPSFDWRLEAKDPGAEWNLRHTVGFGHYRLFGAQWPPSRDDVLSAIIELAMSMDWSASGVTIRES